MRILGYRVLYVPQKGETDSVNAVINESYWRRDYREFCHHGNPIWQMFKRRESSAEDPGSDSEVELIGVKDRISENSSSNGNVYCIINKWKQRWQAWNQWILSQLCSRLGWILYFWIKHVIQSAGWFLTQKLKVCILFGLDNNLSPRTFTSHCAVQPIYNYICMYVSLYA